MKKGKNPTDGDKDDAALWKAVTGSVKAYTGSRAKPVARKVPAPAKPLKKDLPPVSISAPPARYLAKAETASPRGFDKHTESKLKKGRLPVEGTLDLHGMTQDEAFRALHRFIPSAMRQGKRTVLVVTGKGRVSESGGVLRRMVPIWLMESDLRAHVIGYTPAQPKDGGSGALYVRLRRGDK